VKLTELIQDLRTYLDEFGDVPVYVVTGTDNGLQLWAPTDTDYDKYSDEEGTVVEIVASGEPL